MKKWLDQYQSKGEVKTNNYSNIVPNLYTVTATDAKPTAFQGEIERGSLPVKIKGKQVGAKVDPNIHLKHMLGTGAVAALPFAAPAIGAAGSGVMGALQAPLTIGSTSVPWLTGANILGAGFGLYEANNLADDIKTGYYTSNAPMLDKVSTGLMRGVGLLGMPGAVEGIGSHLIGPAYKGLNKLGTNLVTNTPLRNAWKLNPRAFKTKPGNIYRQVGQAGFDDAIREGVIYNKGQKKFLSENPGFDYLEQYNRLKKRNGIILQKPAPAPFFQKDNLFFPINRKATGFGNQKTAFSDAEYLFERKTPKEGFLPRYRDSYSVEFSKTSPTGVLLPEQANLNNFNLYKRHWLQGYKPINVPKKSFSLNYEKILNLSNEEILNKTGRSKEDWELFINHKPERYGVELEKVYNSAYNPTEQHLENIEKGKNQLIDFYKSQEYNNRLQRELGLSYDEALQYQNNLINAVNKTTPRFVQSGNFGGLESHAMAYTKGENSQGTMLGIDFSKAGLERQDAPYLASHEYGHTSIYDSKNKKILENLPKLNLDKETLENWTKWGIESGDKVYDDMIRYYSNPDEARQRGLNTLIYAKNNNLSIDDIVNMPYSEVVSKNRSGEIPSDVMQLRQFYNQSELKNYLKNLFSISGAALLGTGAALQNQKKNGGVINDNRGQWAHPGKVTRINSNNITMQGVPYPVVGVSNTGHTQYMMPGQEYKYDGDYVTEYPIMRKGGQRNYRNRFNTELDDTYQKGFEYHSNLFPGLMNDNYDYDTKGFYKEVYDLNNGDYNAITEALTPNSPTAHVGFDRFKKPNHPTFSNESMYTIPFIRRGGKWGHDEQGDYFKAIKRNIRNMNASDGSPLNYFKRAEDYNKDGIPDVNLIYKGENVFAQGGEMIKRADGSYSRRGLWDNIRANRGSGKKPTRQMLDQERKIKAQMAFGGQLFKAQTGVQTTNQLKDVTIDNRNIFEKFFNINEDQVRRFKLPEDVYNSYEANKKVNAGKNFGVVSKKNARAYFFDENANLAVEDEVGFGKDKGEQQPVYYQIMSTPSGTYRMERPKFAAPVVDKLKQGYDANNFFYIDNIDPNKKLKDVPGSTRVAVPRQALHGIPKHLIKERLKYFNNGNLSDNYMSAGCINCKRAFLDNPYFDKFQNGYLYVLPEKRNGGDLNNYQIGGTSYTVKEGDNLTNIAKANNIPLTNLIKLNNITNPDLIQVGQKLNLSKNVQKQTPINNNNFKGYNLNLSPSTQLSSAGMRDNTAAPIILPGNVNATKTIKSNGVNKRVNVRASNTQSSPNYTNIDALKNARETEERLDQQQELYDYNMAQMFHDYNPLAIALGTRNKPVTMLPDPTTREMLYGAGAGIQDYYHIDKLGAANEFINPAHIVSSGITSPWLQAPLSAEKLDSYLPYASAALSTGLTLPLVKPAMSISKGLLNPRRTIRNLNENLLDYSTKNKDKLFPSNTIEKNGQIVTNSRDFFKLHDNTKSLTKDEINFLNKELENRGILEVQRHHPLDFRPYIFKRGIVPEDYNFKTIFKDFIPNIIKGQKHVDSKFTMGKTRMNAFNQYLGIPTENTAYRVHSNSFKNGNGLVYTIPQSNINYAEVAKEIGLRKFGRNDVNTLNLIEEYFNNPTIKNKKALYNHYKYNVGIEGNFKTFDPETFFNIDNEVTEFGKPIFRDNRTVIPSWDFITGTGGNSPIIREGNKFTLKDVWDIQPLSRKKNLPEFIRNFDAGKIMGAKNFTLNNTYRVYPKQIKQTFQIGGNIMAIGGQSTLNPYTKPDGRNWLEFLKD